MLPLHHNCLSLLSFTLKALEGEPFSQSSQTDECSSNRTHQHGGRKQNSSERDEEECTGRKMGTGNPMTTPYQVTITS